MGVKLFVVSSLPFVPIGQFHKTSAREGRESSFLFSHVIIRELAHLDQLFCRKLAKVVGIGWSGRKDRSLGHFTKTSALFLRRNFVTLPCDKVHSSDAANVDRAWVKGRRSIVD